MLNDESWIKALGFKETADQLVNETGGGTGIAAVDVMLLGLLVEKLSGLLALDVLGEWLTKALFEFLHH